MSLPLLHVRKDPTDPLGSADLHAAMMEQARHPWKRSQPPDRTVCGAAASPRDVSRAKVRRASREELKAWNACPHCVRGVGGVL